MSYQGSGWGGFLVHWLKFGLLCYACLLAGILLLQHEFIYHPEKQKYEDLMAEADSRGFRPWMSFANEFIGWKSVPRLGVAKYRCLIIHGNAGNALRRTHYAQGLRATSDRNDWEIYILEYPGYGAREGELSEDSFRSAAVDAFEQLRTDTRPIFIIGESLGSSVAAQVAAHAPDKVAGLFLVTPFNNLRDVGWSHFPMFPLYQLMGTFLQDKFATDEALKEYDGPVAFMVAEQDEVVPARLGELLYNGYHGPKQMWIIKDSRHNDISFSPMSGWWQEVFRFLSKNAVYTKSS